MVIDIWYMFFKWIRRVVVLSRDLILLFEIFTPIGVLVRLIGVLIIVWHSVVWSI